mgnify:CR=1 FL=1
MNPWVTYIVDHIMFVKGLLEVIAIMWFIPFVFLFGAKAVLEVDNQEEQKLAIKRAMYIIAAMIAMLTLATLITNREICTAMILEVAK